MFSINVDCTIVKSIENEFITQAVSYTGMAMTNRLSGIRMMRLSKVSILVYEMANYRTGLGCTCYNSIVTNMDDVVETTESTVFML